MPIFDLDQVRNARIDQQVELLLEEVREDVIRFDFPDRLGSAEDILEAYDLARPRLNALLVRINAPAGSRGADISTGLGFLPLLLQRRGLQVIATERDLDACDFVRAHGVAVLPYHLGRNAAPLPLASLDFLVFAEVLEHLKLSPIPVLRELTALLRPGGQFILTTPNIARLQHLQALAAGENFLESFPDNLPLQVDATDYVEHVREYSIREVLDSMEGAGLVIDSVEMTGWGPAGYNPLPNPFVNEICLVVAHT